MDMFASPGNKKFPQYCARFPHWSAKKVDALTCPIIDLTFIYANPPWTLIGKWLNRLLDHPHIMCWMIVPMWVSVFWWPLLLRMKVPKSPVHKIEPFPGMFSNCMGVDMPPPRWPLLSILLSGKHYREKKFQLKALTVTCTNWVP